MSNLPVFFDLNDRHVLVVGATAAAFARAYAALKAGARVTMVDDAVYDAFKRAGYPKEEALILKNRAFKVSDLNGIALLFVAHEDASLARTVGLAARKKNILTNVLDQVALSDFITPATVERGPIQIAISTGGTAPVLARKLRLAIERLLSPSLGVLATKAGRVRSAVREAIPVLSHRRDFWNRVFSNPATHEKLDDTAFVTKAKNYKERTGYVSIVGAGPGDADLLTLKAQRALSEADVILYDRLVSNEVLNHARVDAERIYVGKRQSDHGVGQKGIEKLLIDYASQGKHVVRLKGGDPSLFARLGEELDVLRANNIETEIVPGITALAGIAASTQIPLTDRDYADSLTLITGQRAGGSKQDWSGIVGEGRTLAVYMGLKTVVETVEDLLADGISAATPVAVIENGTKDNERRFYGRLDELTGIVALHAIKSPALIIIGDVVAKAADLAEPLTLKHAA